MEDNFFCNLFIDKMKLICKAYESALHVKGDNMDSKDIHDFLFTDGARKILSMQLKKYSVITIKSSMIDFNYYTAKKGSKYYLDLIQNDKDDLMIIIKKFAEYK